MDRILYNNPLMSSEIFMECSTHKIPYPKGAKCPACEETEIITNYSKNTKQFYKSRKKNFKI